MHEYNGDSYILSCWRTTKLNFNHTPHFAGRYFPGIKTGRYTYEKRRKDTVEVRLMKAKEAEDSALKCEEDRQEQIKQLIEEVVEARRRNYKDSDQDDNRLKELQKDFIVSFPNSCTQSG